MLGEHPRDRRRDAASTRLREHPVADLDDLPLAVEMVKHAAADDLARSGVDGREGHQPAASDERRQVAKRGDEPVAIERGQVAGVAKLRVGERRQDRVDVVQGRKPEDEIPGPDALGRNREAQRRLAGAHAASR